MEIKHAKLFDFSAHALSGYKYIYNCIYITLIKETDIGEKELASLKNKSDENWSKITP